MTDLIHVAVGVIVREDGRVLIARRPPDVHQGDLWEFPGGKLEAGENVLSALQRELQEELGINVDPLRCFPFTKIRHRYGEREVLLDTWRVDSFRGEPRGQQRQPLLWCLPDELGGLEFPVANRAIIRLLQLPRLMAITGDFATHRDFLLKLEALLRQGVRLIQFRQPGPDRVPARSIVEAAVALCAQYRARLLLNTSPDTLTDLPVHGLHLNAARLMALRERPVGAEMLFSASCHNREELAHAERLGADFVVLSPVKPTRSHPGIQPLGWRGFKALAAGCSLPVYALGGMTRDDLARAGTAGAYGVAGISDFWD